MSLRYMCFRLIDEDKRETWLRDRLTIYLTVFSSVFVKYDNLLLFDTRTYINTGIYCM